MRRAIVSEIVTGDAPFCYWPIFSLSPVTVPEVFSKVYSAQFFSGFKVANEHLSREKVPLVLRVTTFGTRLFRIP